MFGEFALMERAFGAEVAYKLANRLALLSAADTLALVPTTPPIKRRLLNRDGRFAVSVSAKLELVFRPLSGDAGEARDLRGITAIQIEGVEKT
jgi:hypothetical protein